MKRHSSATLLSLCLLLPAIAPAQTAPAFTVASIKPGDGNIIESRPNLFPGRFVWTTDLPALIAWAYNADIQWVRGEIPRDSTYRIEATFNPPATTQVRAMLLSLLVTRFGMSAHRGEAEQPGYALVVANGGLKIHEATLAFADNAGHVVTTLPVTGVVEVSGNKVSIAELAAALSRSMKAKVWDKTGLTGAYDFRFRAALDDAALTDNSMNYPRLSDALRQEYGLQLEKQTGTVETIVVDHIEKLPTEN